MGQRDKKDPDALRAAETALLVAEMEVIIARAKAIVADRTMLEPEVDPAHRDSD